MSEVSVGVAVAVSVVVGVAVSVAVGGWDMTAFLVTGSEGFVGKAVLRELDARGVRHIPSRVNPYNATHVIHCGWPVRPGRYKDPEEQLSALQSTCRLFRQCQDYGVEHFVGVGSCLEGKALDLYATSKLATAGLLEVLSLSGTTRMSWVRLFQPYGPGEGAHRLIPTVLRHLRAGEPLRLRTDGRQVRDWTYIDDVARGLVDICLGAGPLVQDLELSTCQPLSVRNVVWDLECLVRQEGLVTFGDAVDPVPEIWRNVGDFPGVGVSEGLRRTVEAFGDR